MQTAVFDRKTDAKTWVAKVEADIRCGRQQLYAESRKHTFAEAVERYRREQSVSVVKRGHLEWWRQEVGSLYLQDIRPSLISKKKQKLLTEPTAKGIFRDFDLVKRKGSLKRWQVSFIVTLSKSPYLLINLHFHVSWQFVT